MAMETGLDGLKNEIQQLRVVVEQNNAMLHSIQRRARMSILFSALKWAILIGLSFGALYFVKPYLETAMESYDSIRSMFMTK